MTKHSITLPSPLADKLVGILKEKEITGSTRAEGDSTKVTIHVTSENRKEAKQAVKYIKSLIRK